MTEHAPIQDRFDVTVLAPGDPARGQLRRTALPGPLHMLPALARYPFLSLAERTSVSRPALAMRFVDPADPGSTSSASVTGWRPVARASAPAGPCGTCSPSRP